MTDEEFTEILDRGRETSGVEFKGPGPVSERRLIAQVVRAVLAMANRQGGGVVIVGVEDAGSSINPLGLSPADLETWTYDRVADQIASYADPNASFDLETRVYNDASFVVIIIEEFAQIPVLCKRAFDNVLRDGACYVRTHRKPETSEIPNQTEMRELLDLAIDKGVSRFLERARRVGLYPTPDTAYPTDQELFSEQRRDVP